MKQISLIFLIITLTILPSCKFFKDRGLFNKKAQTLVLLKARQESLRIADSLRNVQNQLLALENARLDSINKATDEKIALSRYSIIVGSFITHDYAVAYADQYQKERYETKIIPVEVTKFELVVAASHEQFSQAVSRLNQFHDTVNIDAWLYTRK
jgi:hypothetical protein